MLVYTGELERAVRENFKVQVFLLNDLSDSAKTTIEKNLASRAYVWNKAAFITKEEAKKILSNRTGEDYSFLGENLLRESFQFAVKPAFQDTTKLTSIRKEISGWYGVFQVHYEESSISAINKNRNQISLVLVGIASVLFVVVILLINNTLRLALFAQRFLIRSMQLVGATRGFIKKPFLIRAVLYGFLGGAIASGLLIGFVSMATSKVPELQYIQNIERMALVLGSITLLGIFVALVSTFRAINKYLNLSLDELY